MMRRIGLFGFLLWFSIFLSSDAAAVDWLTNQQQADGSFASAEDIATPFQSTAEAIRTLRALNRHADVSSADAYLATQPYHSTEYLSRMIIAGTEAGGSATPLLSELMIHQNQDGGFGEGVGYGSTPLDTAFATQALVSAGQLVNTTNSAALSYLSATQRTDGGWPPVSG